MLERIVKVCGQRHIHPLEFRGEVFPGNELII